jgi:hypothetical protein
MGCRIAAIKMGGPPAPPYLADSGDFSMGHRAAIP